MAEHLPNEKGFGGGAGRWVFWGFLLIAAYFVIAEHRAHVVQFLPFLLLLACPLLHMFHGHGGHGSDRTSEESPDAQKDKSPPEPAPGSKDSSSQRPHHR